MHSAFDGQHAHGCRAWHGCHPLLERCGRRHEQCHHTYKVLVLGNTLSVNSELSSAYGTLTTVTIPSTGVLTTANIVATGTDKVGITLTTQPETSYTHKVTWFIPSAAYTSGEVSLIAGDLYDEYTIPQAWINATTKTTTSVTATCKVETFNGAASIGSNSYTFVVSVPSKSTFTLSKGSVSASGSDANVATVSPSFTGYSHKITWSTSGYGSGTINLASGTTTHSYSVPLTWNNSAPDAESFTVTCVGNLQGHSRWVPVPGRELPYLHG